MQINTDEINGARLAQAEPEKLKKVEVGSRIAIYASLTVNLFMVILKVGVWGFTGSEAIFAATLDGIMDVVSQTLNFASRKITRTEKYPMGRERTSSVGCIICATLMISMALGTILKTVEGLVNDGIKQPKDELWVLICLCTGIGLKLSLFIYCYSLKNKTNLDQVLCQDHMNDVLTNSIALTCQHFAAHHKHLAFLDSSGAILICIYILISWIPHVYTGFKQSIGYINEDINSKVNGILNNKQREQDEVIEVKDNPDSSSTTTISSIEKIYSKQLMIYPFKFHNSHTIWSGDQVLIFLTYQKPEENIKLEEFISFKNEVEQILNSNIDIISRITIDFVSDVSTDRTFDSL